MSLKGSPDSWYFLAIRHHQGRKFRWQPSSPWPAPAQLSLRDGSFNEVMSTRTATPHIGVVTVVLCCELVSPVPQGSSSVGDLARQLDLYFSFLWSQQYRIRPYFFFLEIRPGFVISLVYTPLVRTCLLRQGGLASGFLFLGRPSACIGSLVKAVCSGARSCCGSQAAEAGREAPTLVLRSLAGNRLTGNRFSEARFAEEALVWRFCGRRKFLIRLGSLRLRRLTGARTLLEGQAGVSAVLGSAAA